jgi:DNA-3-methyladenine glycosylase
LTVALGVGRSMNGADVAARASALRVHASGESVRPRVRWGSRVGVSAAVELPWRAWLEGEPTVSAYRPHVPKRRRAGASSPKPG